jgi:hypothetical protein
MQWSRVKNHPKAAINEHFYTPKPRRTKSLDLSLSSQQLPPQNTQHEELQVGNPVNSRADSSQYPSGKATRKKQQPIPLSIGEADSIQPPSKHRTAYSAIPYVSLTTRVRQPESRLAVPGNA